MFNNVKIPLGRAAVYGEMDVDTSKFNSDVQKHIYIYGLRQILNDAIAQKNDPETGIFIGKENLVAKAQKRLDNLLTGNLRAQSAEILDGKTQIVFNLLKEALLTKWRAAGDFGNFPKGTKNRFLFYGNKLRAASGKSEIETENEYLETVLSANPKTRERFERRAEEILAERNEDLGIEI